MNYSEQQANEELKQLQEDLKVVKHPITVSSIEHAIDQRKYYLGDIQLQSLLQREVL